MATRQECLVTALVRWQESSPEFLEYIRVVHRILSEQYADYEIILIAPSAKPDEGVSKLLSELECVRSIRLSRQVDQDVALTAGLELSIGDFVVVLEPLKTPAELIVELVDQSRRGAHIVLGVPVGRQVHTSPVYRFSQGVFRRLAHGLLGSDLPGLNADTMVFSRKAVHALTHIRQKRRHLAVLLPEMGFPWTIFPYEPLPSGHAPYRRPLLRSIRTGLSVLIEGSTLPLRMVGVTGLVGSFLSVLYAVYVVVVNLIRNDVVEGWTTLSLQISGLMFLVFVMLTLLGEYMVRVLKEASDRPLYHLAEERTSSVMVRDAARRNIFYQSKESPEADEPTEVKG